MDCSSETVMTNDVISLNVGGCLYVTTESTLLRHTTSKLCKFILLRKYRLDYDGNIVLNRDGPSFRYILNYLRDGENVALPESQSDLKCLLNEAKFYQLTGLMELIDASLMENEQKSQREDIEQIRLASLQIATDISEIKDRLEKVENGFASLAR